MNESQQWRRQLCFLNLFIMYLATKSRLRETYERVTTGATTIVLSEFIYYVFIMTTRF